MLCASITFALTAEVAEASPSAGCSGPEVTADVHVEARWAEAVAALRAALAPLTDVDTCGRVMVFGAGNDVVVQVALRDGRAAARRVVRPDELAATAGSLLLLPPRLDEAPRAAPATPAEPAFAAASPAPASAAVGLELGMGLVGRVGASPAYGGLGVQGFAQLDAGRWLLALRFRVSPADRLLRGSRSDGYSMRSAALAALAGARARPGPLTVDALAGAALVTEGQDFDHHGREGEFATTYDARLGGELRVALARAKLSPFGALDAELSPGRLLGQRRQLAEALPTLPTWSVGVTLGLRGVLF